MKVIVTGSLGNIGKPLAEKLVEKGHTVTVISSKPEKQKDIEALDATAAIGSLEDVDFLVSTFSADAVFAMVPPSYTVPDVRAYYRSIGNNYAQVIQQSGVTFTDEQTQDNLEESGMPGHIAASFVELGASIHSSALQQNYELNKPAIGKVKLEDFAKEFAAAF